MAKLKPKTKAEPNRKRPRTKPTNWDAVPDARIPVKRLQTDIVKRSAKPSVEAFLRGPVPLHWLAKACKLPKSALVVAMLVWFCGGMVKSKQAIRLAPTDRKKLHVSERQLQRGLKALEGAKLVRVRRFANRAPEVEILQASPKAKRR